jgi:hypothetical protein
VILDDVEQLRGSHLKYVYMKELTAEAGLRLRYGGLQQAGVPNHVGAAVFISQKHVDFNDVFDVEELWIHSASFSNVS